MNTSKHSRHNKLTRSDLARKGLAALGATAAFAAASAPAARAEQAPVAEAPVVNVTPTASQVERNFRAQEAIDSIAQTIVHGHFPGKRRKTYSYKQNEQGAVGFTKQTQVIVPTKNPYNKNKTEYMFSVSADRLVGGKSVLTNVPMVNVWVGQPGPHYSEYESINLGRNPQTGSVEYSGTYTTPTVFNTEKSSISLPFTTRYASVYPSQKNIAHLNDDRLEAVVDQVYDIVADAAGHEPAKLTEPAIQQPKGTIMPGMK